MRTIFASAAGRSFAGVFFAVDDVDPATERGCAGGPSGSAEWETEAEVGELNCGPGATGWELRRIHALNGILTDVANDGPGAPVEIDLTEWCALGGFDGGRVCGLVENVAAGVAVDRLRYCVLISAVWK